ncbi:MAG: phage tail tape measure protein, partial [Pseudomonadota bacterium]
AAVVGVTAALVALNIAAIATRYSFLFLKGGALTAAIGISRAAGLIVAATKGLRVAVLGAGMLAALGAGGGIFGALAASATAAVGAIKAAAVAIGAAIMSITWPIALVIAAVAGVALAVHRYWEPIREFTAGFAEAVSEGLGGVLEAISGFRARLAGQASAWTTNRLIDFAAMIGIDEATVRIALDRAYAATFGKIEAIVSLIRSVPERVSGWISEIFTMKDYSAEAEAGFREAGRRAGKALVDAIIEAFDALWEFVKSIPDRIVSMLGTIDLGNLFSFGFGGSPAPTPAAKAVDGARAAGGPIVGGRTYLTGEKGAELITPDKSGYVHDAQATKRMLSDPSVHASASGLSVQFGDIIIQEASNAREIAQQIGDEVQSVLAGVQADTGYTT